jgi:recombination protein RecA
MDAFEIKQAQNNGKIVCVVAMDSVDMCALRAAGVNVPRLLVSQPDNAAQAAEIVETLVRSGTVDIIAVPACIAADAMVRIRDYAARTGTKIAA